MIFDVIYCAFLDCLDMKILKLLTPREARRMLKTRHKKDGGGKRFVISFA